MSMSALVVCTVHTSYDGNIITDLLFSDIINMLINERQAIQNSTLFIQNYRSLSLSHRNARIHTLTIFP